MWKIKVKLKEKPQVYDINDKFIFKTLTELCSEGTNYT